MSIINIAIINMVLDHGYLIAVVKLYRNVGALVWFDSSNNSAAYGRPLRLNMGGRIRESSMNVVGSIHCSDVDTLHSAIRAACEELGVMMLYKEHSWHDIPETPGIETRLLRDLAPDEVERLLTVSL